MSKRAKPGVDLRAPNPTKTKRLGRSRGPLVFNEHVGHKVTQKIDEAITNRKQ
jgi:hypothetical protein|tara:strand:+ start:105 stop:263 length:159 start_codon:yes stop_codon:yes gene_type:complete